MTHELKNIIQQYQQRGQEQRAVLATVVALDGSSYRRPGVRMLIFENGDMVGAVSGGCVEKEVLRQAQAVFSTGVSRIMIYDGRYRLGCEGILYILLETFKPIEPLLKQFWTTIEKRKPLSICSYFIKKQSDHQDYHTLFQFDDRVYPVSEGKVSDNPELLGLQSNLGPLF